MTRIRLAVFISGRGSNLYGLITACLKPNYPAEIVLVVSDKADAPGLRYVPAHIPICTAPHTSRKEFVRLVEHELVVAGVELIALAGFMRILDADFVNRWERRILNIHPSLLPAFPGLHPQRQALAAGVKYSGCTVHYVIPEVDAGPIIDQAVVEVLESDTEERLSSRILLAEHVLYPRAIDKVARQMLNQL